MDFPIKKTLVTGLLGLAFSSSAMRAGYGAAAGEEPAKGDTFQLQDGDRVVFLGDSLTASRGYTDTVELYTLMGYPDRKIVFFNAGIGGDTAQGGLKRLQETVLNHKPTVVTVCFGINDIGWGGMATPERIQGHYEGMRGIIEACQKAGARVVMLGPCPTKMSDPEPASDIIREMSIKDRAMADEMGAQSINLYDQFQTIQRKIREADKEKDAPTHAGDGIHLAPVGNMAFAYILLKGFGAPNVISSLEIDAIKLQTLGSSYRSSASEISSENGSLTFLRKDEGWPVNAAEAAWQSAAFIPVHTELAQYRLRIANLTGSNWYAIKVNDMVLRAVTAKDLNDGMNLTLAIPPVFGPTPPWTYQAEAANNYARARSQLVGAKYVSGLTVPNGSAEMEDLQRKTQKQIDNISELLRELAPTKPVRFEILPTEDPK